MAADAIGREMMGGEKVEKGRGRCRCDGFKEGLRRGAEREQGRSRRCEDALARRTGQNIPTMIVAKAQIKTKGTS